MRGASGPRAGHGGGGSCCGKPCGKAPAWAAAKSLSHECPKQLPSPPKKPTPICDASGSFFGSAHQVPRLKNEAVGRDAARSGRRFCVLQEIFRGLLRGVCLRSSPSAAAARAAGAAQSSVHMWVPAAAPAARAAAAGRGGCSSRCESSEPMVPAL